MAAVLYGAGAGHVTQRDCERLVVFHDVIADDHHVDDLVFHPPCRRSSVNSPCRGDVGRLSSPQTETVSDVEASFDLCG